MSAFSAVIKNSPEFMSIVSALQSGKTPMGIIGLTPVHKAHYISALCSEMKKKCLIICPDEGSATKLCDDLNTFCGGAYVYPARDYNFRGAESQSKEFEQRRIGVLSRMIDGDYQFILASGEAAMQLTLPLSELKKRTLHIKSGEELSQHTIIRTLLSAGYVRADQVGGAGQFSIRGGILDIFPPGSEYPVRIEFWGDTVDSVSYFDLDTQRRTEMLDFVKITPSSEVLFDSPEEMKKRLEAFRLTVKGKGSVKVKASIEQDIDRLEHFLHISSADKYLSLAYDELHSIFDYLGDGLLFVCESALVKQKFTSAHQLLFEDIRTMFEEGYLAKGLDRYSLSWNDFLEQYEKCGAIFADNLTRGSFDVPVRELVSVTAQQLSRWDGTLSVLREDLLPALESGYTAVVMAGTAKSASELAFDLESDGVKARYFPVVPGEFPKHTVTVLAGKLSSGFEYNALKFILFTYGRGETAPKKEAKKKFKTGRGITSLEEISKGDYIVHAVYGIGVFDGIQTMKMGGTIKDFIKINYRGTDVLYLPVTQLDLISKYVSPRQTDKPIKLNKLGTDEWKKTQTRVKAAVRDMAEQLTKIYSARINSKGYAFSPDMDMQSDFERRFEYEETDDQLEAVNEIKRDMERPAPMDRLLCGDVGFGKTEVALRAAFKCVADGKQCAILVPTTILAFQHFQTIKKRFDGFPVEIDMISRFRTQTEKAKIKKALKRGSIDIIVGTHSLIAKNVEFRDLGLLIVDEEQRFGVAQKEKLKEKFPLVDVLTLSATPIPRTLNMAMTGIRDMSVLEIPPVGRHPVQTYVIAHDMAVLAAAMERELRRGGQVYYLHNRVDTIEATARKIKEFLPDARIGIGHGKMSEEELSEVWRRLLENEIDILVCTTIIETGVDVPNANTLIIEDADRLGLAQLHQIRGRVGRSQRRAFAYFTYNGNKALPEISQKRLSAIREFTEFGAGFHIAQRDLEIRGAGNILGANQHGHMEAVGYEMYLRLLGEAIEEERTGEPVEETKECVVDVNVDAHIPEDYIDSVKNRIFMYKRIAQIQNGEDAMDVMDEFIDRFGEPPASVKGLVDVALLRAYAARLGIYEIKQEGSNIIARLNGVAPEKLIAVAQSLGSRGMIKATSAQPYIVFKLGAKSPLETMKEMIEVLSGALKQE
ncbi:MAG: transcription-repair coupling factor [Oscillospiraceae bacterium]|nr:transcription-repair coupling factor [Oscillospiraceae bacterium]